MPYPNLRDYCGKTSTVWPKHVTNDPLKTSETAEEALLKEVRELRSEIAALRSDLVPVNSLILTGKAAINEFAKLKA